MLRKFMNLLVGFAPCSISLSARKFDVRVLNLKHHYESIQTQNKILTYFTLVSVSEAFPPKSSKPPKRFFIADSSPLRSSMTVF